MYNGQKSMPIEEIAQCLDVCAGVIMMTAGIYIEVTFGDLFSTAGNTMLVGGISTVAALQICWRYVTVGQEQSAIAPL